MSIHQSLSTRLVLLAVTASFSALTPSMVHAQVTAPSIYTTTIQVQGELPIGTEFADWAGIPITDMDPVDNPGGPPPFIDIGDIQIANDNEFIYIHATTHGGHTSLANLFLAFDTDQNVATGFDPFAVGVIGSEFGYQTDFAFGQATGVYNTGAPTGGGPFGSGGALIYPFWTEAGAPQGTELEWAVPRNATVSGAPVFASDSFDFAIWADSGLGDISQRISYTFADPPAGLPGDFNNDNTVDAADYVVWRRDDGSPEEYDEWRSNFGESGAGSGWGGTAVPEPTAVCLLMAAALAIGASRRSR